MYSVGELKKKKAELSGELSKLQKTATRETDLTQMRGLRASIRELDSALTVAANRESQFASKR